MSLSPVRLIELIYKPSGAGGTPQRSRAPQPTRSRTEIPRGEEKEREGDMRRPQERTESEPKQEQTPEIDVKKPSKFAESEVLKKFHGWMRKVTPINISYTENVNKTGMGILGEVPLGYRFGWIREHGLEHTKQVGSNTGDWDHKRDFSVRSGLNLTRSLS